MGTDETRQFLEILFGDKPDSASVQIWIRALKPVTWFCADLNGAATVAINAAKQFDVYVGCGIGQNAYDKPQRQRLKADEVMGIPGVWADIDVNGGPDAKEGAAPTYEAAIELANELLEPTVLVSSGYGLQAWWLLEDPLMFRAVGQREQAKRIVTGYQGALRAAARRLGWSLDATQDLARVMRLPGTFNHKGDKPVEVTLVSADGKRYQIEEIAELGQGFQTSAVNSNGAGPHIEIRTGVSADPRWIDLMQEQDFVGLWSRKRKLRGDNSLSAFEWQITLWLVRAGLTDQATADLLVIWRNQQEPGDPRKKLRADRLSQTIGKVRASLQHELEAETVDAEREAAIDHLEQVNAGIAPTNEAKLIAMFNRVIGGPEIAQLKQFTRDPVHARFNIELADGREVPLGKFEMIASQTQFRRAYAAVTGHYPKFVKGEKWDTAVAGLLKTAKVVDNIEDSGVGQLELMIDDYISYAGTEDRDGACASGQPFIEDGATHISLGSFVNWLRRSQGEHAERSDIAAQLRAIGYERRTLNFNKSNGTHSSRSYFVTGHTTRPRGPRPSDRRDAA